MTAFVSRATPASNMFLVLAGTALLCAGLLGVLNEWLTAVVVVICAGLCFGMSRLLREKVSAPSAKPSQVPSQTFSADPGASPHAVLNASSQGGMAVVVPEEDPAEEALDEAISWMEQNAEGQWPGVEECVVQLQGWVDKGLTLETEDGEGLTVFSHACLFGAPVGVLEWLESRGVKVSEHFELFDRLFFEDTEPSVEVLEFFLARGASSICNSPDGLEEYSSLLEVCLNNEWGAPVMAALVKAGATDTWVESEDQTLLTTAIYLERPLEEIAVLAHAFDVNAHHGMALRQAVAEGGEEVVELLMGLGADPFLRNEDGEEPAALSAVEGELWDLVNIFLEHVTPEQQQRILGQAEGQQASSDTMEDLENWVSLVLEGRAKGVAVGLIENPSSPRGRLSLSNALANENLLEAVRALEFLSDEDRSATLATLEPSPALAAVLMLVRNRQAKRARGKMVHPTDADLSLNEPARAVILPDS